jgi:hypothetical protein
MSTDYVRPRHPKTNAAIRAAVRAWWRSPSQTSARARDAEAWARFPKALTYEDSLRPSTVVNYAQPKGYRTTAWRGAWRTVRGAKPAWTAAMDWSRASAGPMASGGSSCPGRSVRCDLRFVKIVDGGARSCILDG